jgi:hypothetical protein
VLKQRKEKFEILDLKKNLDKDLYISTYLTKGYLRWRRYLDVLMMPEITSWCCIHKVKYLFSKILT